MATELAQSTGPDAAMVQASAGDSAPEVLNKFEILLTIFGEVGDLIDGTSSAYHGDSFQSAMHL
jgi:hypothetical protein